MKMEIISIIFIIGLNFSAALSQDSLKVQDAEINNLKERITLLESDIEVLNVSKVYFLGVMAISAGIYAVISVIAVTANYIMSKRKVIELVKAEITEQIKLVESEKEKAIEIIENNYNEKFELFEIANLKSQASHNRTMSLVTSDDHTLSLLWVMRTINYLEEIRKKENVDMAIEKYEMEVRTQFNSATITMEKMETDSFTEVNYYNEIDRIINGVDRTKFKRELKLFNKELDRIYNP